MPIREDMRNLAEEIVHSYEDRSARIAELRKTLKSDLKNTRIDLARSESGRKASVSTLLKDISAAHAAMSGELKAGLTGGAANLRQDVANILEGFGETHEAMKKETKADLAKGVAERKHEVDALLKDVDGMLKGFTQNHNAMTKQMKRDLAKGTAERKRNVDVLFKGFDVKLNEVRTALDGGRDEWQRMATTLQSKRGAAVADVKLPKAAPAPASSKQVAKKAVARAGAAELPPGLAAFRDRVFEYLANHPDGTRLVQLEQKFGMARIQMAKIVKSLIGKNKVEKRDSLYFAI